MDDLISRQAAIDALKRDEAYDEDIPNRADGVRDAIITIIGLPSVQPVLRTQMSSADCISRQAAIDALDKRFDSIPMEQTTEILLLRKDIRDLPSVQPEHSGGLYVDGYNDGYRDGMKDAQPEQQWITCSERLPEKKQAVLVTVADEVQPYTSDDDWTGTGFWAYGKNVTAWMPYPDPWKGEQP